MMNIICIINNKFPIGGAAANRHLAIAKGLQMFGCKYEIHIIRPTEHRENIINNKLLGIYEGVPYIYTPGTVVWKPNTFVNRLYNYCKGVINSLRIINNKHKNEKISFIISGFDEFTFNFLYYLFCKAKRIKFVYHVDEYPWTLIKPENYNYFYRLIFTKHFYKLFDYIIVISTNLKKYYQNKIKNNAEIFYLPMIVDPDRFNNLTKNRSNQFVYLYCGNLSVYKDGIDILIRSFSLLAKEHNNVCLKLIGPTNNAEYANLKKIIEEENIGKKVIFLGEINREQIPQHLIDADVLVLSRPDNIQAEGGFPTKLGEYLLTGNPVITTKVGNIEEFLTNNINVFFAEPNDILSFYEKMKIVIENYNCSLTIGKKGKETALFHFDYKKQIELLFNYLEKLN